MESSLSRGSKNQVAKPDYKKIKPPMHPLVLQIHLTHFSSVCTITKGGNNLGRKETMPEIIDKGFQL